MDTRSCLKKVVATFNIDLHPSKLHDVRGGVQDHLNAQLMRFSEDFGGIVMCVGSFTVLSNQAPVNLYFPLVRVAVRAPMVVFRPQRGTLLIGRVTKVGGDFIGLLVLGVLNASIPKSLIRNEFTCSRLPPTEWRSQKHPQHVIKVGSHVKFHVDKTQENAAFFSISGSLKAKGTGAIDYVGAGHVASPVADGEDGVPEGAGGPKVKQHKGGLASAKKGVATPAGKGGSTPTPAPKPVPSSAPASVARPETTPGSVGVQVPASTGKQRSGDKKEKKEKKKDKKKDKH